MPADTKSTWLLVRLSPEAVSVWAERGETAADLAATIQQQLAYPLASAPLNMDPLTALEQVVVQHEEQIRFMFQNPADFRPFIERITGRKL